MIKGPDLGPLIIEHLVAKNLAAYFAISIFALLRKSAIIFSKLRC